jgi:hypothetical protein
MRPRRQTVGSKCFVNKAYCYWMTTMFNRRRAIWAGLISLDINCSILIQQKRQLLRAGINHYHGALTWTETLHGYYGRTRYWMMATVADRDCVQMCNGVQCGGLEAENDVHGIHIRRTNGGVLRTRLKLRSNKK